MYGCERGSWEENMHDRQIDRQEGSNKDEDVHRQVNQPMWDEETSLVELELHKTFIRT